MKFKVLFLCLISLFLVTGCMKKDVISVDTFETQATEHGLVIQDLSEQYSGNSTINNVVIAVNDEENWQVEFYVLASIDDAKNMYNDNYNKLTEEDSSSTTTINMINYNSYSLTTSSSYKYIIRVDNTVLYAGCEYDDKESMVAFINSLEY